MPYPPVYLKPNVVMEPLLDRWYAWSHLISPATAAMNIAGRHLKIMNSYIQAPQVHAAAVKNPKLLGGPFIDYGGGRVAEIRALRDQTLSRQADLLAFAEALKELDRMLKAQAKGYALAPLYEAMPEPLKGYVELVYDLNNNPSYRLYESLLYKSRYYRPASQSLALWLTDNDQRPFVLSTPRLDNPDTIHLDIPFNHPAIDQLARMKRTPAPVETVREALGIAPEDYGRFDRLFTTTPPPVYKKYDGDKIRMRYFGHACILIETREISILVDPLISYYGYSSDVSRFSDADIPDVIDYVFITHNHQDHILFETLLPLRHKIRQVIVPRGGNGSLQDPSLKLMFQSIGFPNVAEIGDMEALNFGDCLITGVPFIGEHSDLDIRSKICYHVLSGGFSILFMADSCNVASRLYEHVQRELGAIDVLFVGMECEGAPLTWLYGPLLTEDLARDKDNSRRLSGSDYARARAVVDVFSPREVYVYAMGQEPWVEFISSLKYTSESLPIVESDKLLGYCHARDIVAERLFGEKELLYHTHELVH